MTSSTNARIAGFAFLFYIAAGITSLMLFRRAVGGADIPAKLAGIAQHATEIRVVLVLTLLESVCALLLAATLYAITYEQDCDLATLGMICRVVEGVLGALALSDMLALLRLATDSAEHAAQTDGAHALGGYLLRDDIPVAATFFAVGSAIFAYLLLRGRMIPVPLAWLGLWASVLLVAGLPMQLAGVLVAPITKLMWLPMLAFEVPLGVWLIIKGIYKRPLAEPA